MKICAKGFTLIELLAVIIILAIVSVIVIPLINNIIEDVREAAYMDNEEMMVNAAKTYLVLNETKLPVSINSTVMIELEELQSNKLLGNIKNINNPSSNCGGYVLVRKVNNYDYDYKTFLRCDDNYVSKSIITDGMVLDLPLGDYSDGNIYLDKSGNGNNGLNHGSIPSLNRHNAVDKASSFFGINDYIDVPDSKSLSITSGITVSCWFKLKDLTGAYKNLVVKGSSGQQFYWLFLKDNRIYARIMSGGIGYGTSSVADFALEEWVQASFTFDSHYIKIYKNGELIGTPYPFEGTIDTTTTSLKISYLQEWWGEQLAWNFSGEIDDVRIYNRALSENEIKHNFNIDNYTNF